MAGIEYHGQRLAFFRKAQINQSLKASRHRLAGVLILSMIGITILNGLGLLELAFNPLWIAGVGAWLAALLLFTDTSRVLKIQVSLILLAGVGLLLYARSRAATIDLDIVISSSTGLMTMIASVGFLRLVVVPETAEHEPLPTGPTAFLRTIIGLNVASSIINISAPILIADRIHQQRPLQRFSAQTFVRIFCGVSSWSPFFGAMAVVLTYVNDAELWWIFAAGFPFMLIGFIGTYVEARLRFADEVGDFIGYPTHLAALRVPLLLIVSVVLAGYLLDKAPILVLIALCALLVTLAVLWLRHGIGGSLARLRQHIIDGLPRIVNELCLFLAAGVLAAGISALIQHGVFENPFARFDAVTAVQLLTIILLAAVFGIHPIIMISSFSPMILTLEPNPHLLAATFLFGWHIGTCANPLSGTNLTFQGRYGIPGWKIAFWNWPYAVTMLAVGALWLQLVAGFVPPS